MLASRSLRMLAQRAPLTVLRAPHGFGKTLITSQWLRSLAEEEVDVLWLSFAWSLDGASADPVENFWVRLAERLEDFGPSPRSARGGHGVRERVLDLLGRRDRPIFLVLDGYGDTQQQPAIDHELIELLRAAPSLYLVVCTRVATVLEVVGATMVDSVVLRPGDLALTADDIAVVAAKQPIDLSTQEAALLREETGGWPALVQVILAGSAAGRSEGASFALDMDAGKWFLRSVWSQFSSADVAAFVKQTALVGEFTAETAQTLCATDPHGPIESLTAAGLLRCRTEDGVKVYSHLGAVQREARDRLSAEDREAYEILVRLASRLQREQGKIASVLALLTGAQLWEPLVELLAQDWVTIAERHVGALAPALWVVPDAVVMTSPHLLVARKYLLPGDDTSEIRGRGTGEARFQSALSGPRRAADVVVDHFRDVGDDASRLAPAVAEAIPEVLYDWAVGRLAKDGPRQVRGYFADAHRAAVALGSAEMAARSALGAGLVSVFEGEVHEAVRWTEIAELGAAHLRTGVRAERDRLLMIVLTEVVRIGRLEQAGEEVRELNGGDVPDDLWTMGLIARTYAGICTGRAFESFEELEKDPGRIVGVRPDDTLAGLAALGRVDLMLAMGHVQRARDAAAVVSRLDVRLVAQARVALMSGNYGEAVRRADAALAQVATARLRLDVLVVKALAVDARGQEDRARLLLREAAALSAESGLILPFALVPRPLLARHRSAVSELGEILDRLAAGGADGPFPEPRISAELSDREGEVLVALAQSRSLQAVAKNLFLTTNTVKTHLRSIYRKMGVHSREEAVRCAVECGLIEPSVAR
ncbi:MAG: LuxR C-terminal-related transcriptional regulator [Cellulomonadaceae bacterium]